MLVYVVAKYWFFLIKRGGGTGPCETRQPAFGTVPIPAGYILKDEERELGLFMEEIFLFLQKAFHNPSIGRWLFGND
jgi:hypothetical protein